MGRSGGAGSYSRSRCTSSAESRPIHRSRGLAEFQRVPGPVGAGEPRAGRASVGSSPASNRRQAHSSLSPPTALVRADSFRWAITAARKLSTSYGPSWRIPFTKTGIRRDRLKGRRGDGMVVLKQRPAGVSPPRWPRVERPASHAGATSPDRVAARSSRRDRYCVLKQAAGRARQGVYIPARGCGQSPSN